MPSKYRNRRVTKDGITFDSIAELGYYGLLKAREAKGEISNVRVHHPLPLIAYGASGKPFQIGTHKVDFAYDINEETIYDDVKGVDHADGRFRRKIVKACHDIDIRLIDPKTFQPKQQGRKKHAV